MDYMAELAKRMGKEAVIIDMPFDGIIAAVASGKCDVANATHTITAKSGSSKSRWCHSLLLATNYW